MQLDEACSTVGFFLLVNHGAEYTVKEAAGTLNSWFKWIYEGSEEANQDRHSVTRGNQNYGPGLQKPGHMEEEGYSTLEGVYAVGGGRQDFVVINPEAEKRKKEGDEYYASDIAQIWYEDAENQWPSSKKGRVVKPALEDHYREMEKVSEKLMALFAEALVMEEAKVLGTDVKKNAGRELYESRFAPLVDKHTSNLVNAYHADPRIARLAPGGDAEYRVSPHSDTGLFTIIGYGDMGCEGLEVQLGDDLSKGWTEVSTSFGMRKDQPLVVNIADSMTRLSGGRFRATPHRVKKSEPNSVGDRLAIIFFFEARYDAFLEPVVKFDGGDKRLAVRAGQITHNYLTATAESKRDFDAWVETKE
ncbi:hypothetical protein TL16_g11167 [Triparma laevis f. inornata]|uniref:Fe2OG dioxygenase domain-containing protein n=1 Tax=Triparma laevis f. inornata TaxID=1714386 RepID=A0A9W7BH72_9STRA|nr:hypothetical protein TL16_g11167 [Triparma laevis f. inornata]